MTFSAGEREHEHQRALEPATSFSFPPPLFPSPVEGLLRGTLGKTRKRGFKKVDEIG